MSVFFEKIKGFLSCVSLYLHGFKRNIKSLFIGEYESCQHEYRFKTMNFTKTRNCKKCGVQHYYDYYYKIWRWKN